MLLFPAKIATKFNKSVYFLLCFKPEIFFECVVWNSGPDFGEVTFSKLFFEDFTMILGVTTQQHKMRIRLQWHRYRCLGEFLHIFRLREKFQNFFEKSSDDFRSPKPIEIFKYFFQFFEIFFSVLDRQMEMSKMTKRRRLRRKLSLRMKFRREQRELVHGVNNHFFYFSSFESKFSFLPINVLFLILCRLFCRIQ